MRKNNISQMELNLFPPSPEPEQSEIEFKLVLDDGNTVDVKYSCYYFRYTDHFEFRGESVSETGYYSFFFPVDRLLDKSDEKAKELALTVATDLRKKRITEIEKEHRKNKSRKKLI